MSYRWITGNIVLCGLLCGLLFPVPTGAGESVPLECSVQVVDGRFSVEWIDDGADVDRYVIERQTFGRYWWRGRTDSTRTSFVDGVAPVASSRVQYRVTSRDDAGQILALGDCAVADSDGFACQLAETANGYDVSWSPLAGTADVDYVVRRQISDILPFYWRARTSGERVSDGPSPTGIVTYLVVRRVDRQIQAAASCVPPGPAFCPVTRAFDITGLTGRPAGNAQGVAWLTIDLGNDRQTLRPHDVVQETLGAPADLEGREFRRIHSVTPVPSGDVYFGGLEPGQDSTALYRLDADTNTVEPVAPELAGPLALRLLVVNDLLVFNGRSAPNGDELFAVPIGGGDIRLLADINPGPVGSDPELALADAEGGWVYLDASTEFGPRSAHRVNIATGVVELLEDPPLSGDDGFVTGVVGPTGAVWFVRDRAESRTYDIYRFDPRNGLTTQISDLRGSGVPLGLDFVDGDLISVDSAPGGVVVRRYADGIGPAEVFAETEVGIAGTSDVRFLPDRSLILRSPNGADADTLTLVDLLTGAVEAPRNLPIGTLSAPTLAGDRAVIIGSRTLYAISPSRCA